MPPNIFRNLNIRVNSSGAVYVDGNRVYSRPRYAFSETDSDSSLDDSFYEQEPLTRAQRAKVLSNNRFQPYRRQLLDTSVFRWHPDLNMWECCVCGRYYKSSSPSSIITHINTRQHSTYYATWSTMQ